MRKSMFCSVYDMKTTEGRWKVFVGKGCKMLFFFPFPHLFKYIIVLLTNTNQTALCLLVPNQIIMKIVSIYACHIYSIDNSIVFKNINAHISISP